VGVAAVACGAVACRFLGGPQTISDSRFGYDVLRARRIRFEFTSQVADVHPKKVHFIFVADPSPNVPDDLPVRENSVGMVDQGLEYVLFCGCKLDGLLAYQHEALGEVDGEISGGEGGRAFVLIRSPQCNSYSS
jgi:hypothetical protein